MKYQLPVRFTVLLTGLLLFAGWSQIGDKGQLTFQPESKLWVEGTSTIHDWHCEASKIDGFVAADATTITKTSVTVPVGNIDCKNGTMDKKMQKALKADDNPTIRYELLDARVVKQPATENGTYQLEAKGRLTIAGTERPVTMTVEAQRLADGRFRFKGSQPVLMSNFDVDPPSAMLGTIKTGDEVVVHFDVVAGTANS